MALLCAILAHLGARGPNLVAKLLQDGAELAQHSPTSRQDEPPWPPRAPPRPPKTQKTPIGFSTFFAIWPFAPKIPKSRQDTSQNNLKSAILKSKMAILGPSWRQVGQLSAILDLTCPILAPRCAPTDLQVEPQTRPKSHLGPSWRQEGRPGAPNQPWSSNFQGFEPIFDPIFD